MYVIDIYYKILFVAEGRVFFVQILCNFYHSEKDMSDNLTSLYITWRLSIERFDIDFSKLIVLMYVKCF